MKKKIIKFYGSLFQKFLYVYIHVRVNDEDVRVNMLTEYTWIFACMLFVLKRQ